MEALKAGYIQKEKISTPSFSSYDHLPLNPKNLLPFEIFLLYLQSLTCNPNYSLLSISLTMVSILSNFVVLMQQCQNSMNCIMRGRQGIFVPFSCAEAASLFDNIGSYISRDHFTGFPSPSGTSINPLSLLLKLFTELPLLSHPLFLIMSWHMTSNHPILPT